MKQENSTESHSEIFSEAEIKSFVHLMDILDSGVPKDEKKRLLKEGVGRHCEIVLWGGK